MFIYKNLHDRKRMIQNKKGVNESTPFYKRYAITLAPLWKQELL